MKFTGERITLAVLLFVIISFALIARADKPEVAYKGFVDRAQCSVIQGWAADALRLDQSINVQIYDGDKLLATILANGERPDVGDFLGDKGNHGFVLPTPFDLKDGAEHKIRVVFENSDVELFHSGLTLKCDRKEE